MSGPQTVPRSCPTCGASRSPAVLGGQCPSCLLRAALAPVGADGDALASAEAAGSRSRGIDLAGRALGPYRVFEPIGEGGMGVVHRAFDVRLERTVALKLVAPERVDDPAARARFEREARAASALEHPNICPVFDVGDSELGPFLVLPLYDGETLAERLARGPLPVEQVLDVARQTAEGLARAHGAGIVHGDVKPENLMLTADGLVKILDFGLAGLSGEPATAGGTEGYRAPEAVVGARLDPRADLWAIGVVLSEALTGRAGIGADADARGPLEPALDALLARCLEPDPERRIASSREVLRALEQVDVLRLMVAVGELPSPDAVARVPQGRAPSRGATGAAALLLVALLGVSALAVERWDGWSASVSRESVATLRERARVAGGEAAHWLAGATAPRPIGAPEPTETDAPRPSVHWGLAIDPGDAPGKGSPGAPTLWWRSSPRPLVGSPLVVRALDAGRVGPDEPPLAPGEVRVIVAADGRVLERSALGGDGRAASGSAVPARNAGAIRRSLYGFEPLLFVICFGLMVVVAAVLARRNLKRNRGDRRGAARLAGALGALFLLSWLAGGGHAPGLWSEFAIFVQAAGLALFYAALGGLFYLALEPRLRLRWPHVLGGWGRLLAGRLADGVAGREVLAGAALGAGWFLARALVFGAFAPPGEGAIRAPNVRLLEGPGQVAGELVNSLGTAVALGLGVVMVMALARELTRPRWLAPWLVAAIITVGLAWTEPSARALVFWPLLALSAWWVVERFGVLALVAAYLVLRLLWMGLLTASPGALGFGVTVATVAAIVALAGAAAVPAWRASARAERS
ncbi:MAG TPA: serine/threonine-protein kinase [Thermoanaerobaculia bacterium]|nr:serine/threonine-protein kinase [Thermoanaerobaculia bacterium]